MLKYTNRSIIRLETPCEICEGITGRFCTKCWGEGYLSKAVSFEDLANLMKGNEEVSLKDGPKDTGGP